MTAEAPELGGQIEGGTDNRNRLREWSVIAIGLLLGALSIAGAFVGSPGYLTGIGVGIVKCTRDIGGEVDAGLGLSVLSLSTILQYANNQRVFNFLHTITGRVSAADYLGVATIDPTTQNTQEVNTLTSLFDAVIELREADDGSREMRVVGIPDVPRTWVSF